MSRPLAIIDADILLYSATSQSEIEVCWDEKDDIWTLHTDLKKAMDLLRDSIESCTRRYRKHEVVLTFTSPGNWRLKWYPQYKAHRQKTRKPLGFGRIKELLKEDYEFIDFPGFEGDDVCGWLATKPEHKGSVIISRDKDMKTIPGLLFNDSKQEETYITQAEADYNHWFQTLTGDPVDGYPGCPGIGKTKAEAILRGSDPNLTWGRIVQCFKNSNLTEKDAMSQAACARILRYREFDLKRNELLWRPKGFKSSN